METTVVVAARIDASLKDRLVTAVAKLPGSMSSHVAFAVERYVVELETTEVHQPTVKTPLPELSTRPSN